MDTQVDQTNQKKYNLNKNIKYSTETDEYGTRRNLLNAVHHIRSRGAFHKQ